MYTISGGGCQTIFLLGDDGVVGQVFEVGDGDRFAPSDSTWKFMRNWGMPAVASLMSYAVEKRVSKHPERFGTGIVEGVAGPRFQGFFSPWLYWSWVSLSCAGWGKRSSLKSSKLQAWCFLWPASKGVARKKHRRAGNPMRRSAVVSARAGGRSGAWPGAPTRESLVFCVKNGFLARSEKRSLPWFFRATPLLAGPAMPEINPGSQQLAEK
jgi:hypothetical protein